LNVFAVAGLSVVAVVVDNVADIVD